LLLYLEGYDAELGRCLALAGVLHNPADIEIEPGGQLFTDRANFIHDWILNHIGPMNSSGVQITGHENPCRVQIAWTLLAICALAM
jgi:hypothetical protein